MSVRFAESPVKISDPLNSTDDVAQAQEWFCLACDFTSQREHHDPLFCKNCPHKIGYQWNHYHCDAVHDGCSYIGPVLDRESFNNRPYSDSVVESCSRCKQEEKPTFMLSPALSFLGFLFFTTKVQ